MDLNRIDEDLRHASSAASGTAERLRHEACYALRRAATTMSSHRRQEAIGKAVASISCLIGGQRAAITALATRSGDRVPGDLHPMQAEAIRLAHEKLTALRHRLDRVAASGSAEGIICTLRRMLSCEILARELARMPLDPSMRRGRDGDRYVGEQLVLSHIAALAAMNEARGEGRRASYYRDMGAEISAALRDPKQQ